MSFFKQKNMASFTFDRAILHSVLCHVCITIRRFLAGCNREALRTEPGLTEGAWRIIPVSKWLITMLSKSPK